MMMWFRKPIDCMGFVSSKIYPTRNSMAFAAALVLCHICTIRVACAADYTSTQSSDLSYGDSVTVSGVNSIALLLNQNGPTQETLTAPGGNTISASGQGSIGINVSVLSGLGGVPVATFTGNGMNLSVNANAATGLQVRVDQGGGGRSAALLDISNSTMSVEGPSGSFPSEVIYGYFGFDGEATGNSVINITNSTLAAKGSGDSIATIISKVPIGSVSLNIQGVNATSRNFGMFAVGLGSIFNFSQTNNIVLSGIKDFPDREIMVLSATEAATINVTGGGSFVMSIDGANSYGLFAGIPSDLIGKDQLKSTINVSSDAVIKSTGKANSTVFSVQNGVVNLTGPSVIAEGDGGGALVVADYLYGDTPLKGGIINATNVAVTTSGAGTHGAIISGASVNGSNAINFLGGGSISTTGAGAHAISLQKGAV